MPQFRVKVEYLALCLIDVEADDVAHAREVAVEECDFSEFYGGDYNALEVIALEDEEES